MGVRQEAILMAGEESFPSKGANNQSLTSTMLTDQVTSHIMADVKLHTHNCILKLHAVLVDFG